VDIKENDLTRNPTKFMIIAGVRSGGTLLAHSLDSHPLIFCARGEPMHARSEWGYVGITQTLDILTNLTGYMASGLKIQNDQITYGTIQEYLRTHELKYIRLTRENLVHQAISWEINKLSRSGSLEIPQHSFTKVEPSKFELSAERIVEVCQTLEVSNILVSLKLKELNLEPLEITYEQLTHGAVMIQEIPYELTGTLCNHLGVGREPLRNFLYRINALPYSETIINWNEIMEKVATTEYGAYL